jgi:hypothetical protein
MERETDLCPPSQTTLANCLCMSLLIVCKLWADVWFRVLLETGGDGMGDYFLCHCYLCGGGQEEERVEMDAPVLWRSRQ